MRKWLVVAGLVMIAGTVYAVPKEVNKSSFTNSADLSVTISTVASVGNSVIIGTPVPNGYIAFYDARIFSNQVATKTFISLDRPTADHFVPLNDMKFSSGMMYTTNAPGGMLTINWDWIVKPTWSTPQDGR